MVGIHDEQPKDLEALQRRATVDSSVRAHRPKQRQATSAVPPLKHSVTKTNSMTNCLARLVLAVVIPPLFLLLFFAVTGEGADAPLTIVSAGPTGELNALAQGNEIRVVFSEPMVALGRIPDRITAPFSRIAPAVAGTFRWSVDNWHAHSGAAFPPVARSPLRSIPSC